MMDFEGLEVGYDIPARLGMAEAEVQTPALVLDLDALERNVRHLGDYVTGRGLRLRAHGKMHKSVDVAKLQMRIGGAVGICCQKVSEAEVFARGGVPDILVSNEVRDPVKIDRLARLPLSGASVSVCVDDVANVAELATAAARHGTELGVLVEIDAGQGRCGVASPEQAVTIARAVAAAPGLRYEGLQAYQGGMQHIREYGARRAAFDAALDRVTAAVAALTGAGLPPGIVSGAGTGTYRMEAESGVYNELQCGSYAFMDVDYHNVLDEAGRPLDEGEWGNALFVLTSVMSAPRPGHAVVDAGLKSLAVDRGLPMVAGRAELTYARCSDEHGEVDGPDGALAPRDKLRLIPGHCDPTCNLHDWYVGVRGGVVETLWPVSARGKSF